MFIKYYFLIVFINSFVIITSTLTRYVQKCGAFEEFKSCGPPCEHTCYDLIEESTCNKEDICVKGCFCKKGYLRDPFGDCVLPRDCFPENDVIGCGSTEVFDKCNGNCELTCEKYNTQFKCPRKCVPGCLCGEGLVRNEEGVCIPPEYCHKMLPEPQKCNTSLEDFHYCFAGCEPTCANLDASPDCADTCKAGCMCKEGLVRDEKGNCILPQYCDNASDYEEEYCTGAHEVYGCNLCDVKCSTLGLPCQNFSFNCVKKCYCQEGYARDHRNICIPTRKCPRSCYMSIRIFLKLISRR